MTFPAESVPDGIIQAPHHLTMGLVGALFVLFIVWDDYRHAEPVATALGALVALFAFLFVWRLYPAPGALLVLGGLTLSTGAVLRPSWRSTWPTWAWLLVLLALAVAWDDAISHAFGVWTPLDALWRARIYPVIAS